MKLSIVVGYQSEAKAELVKCSKEYNIKFFADNLPSGYVVRERLTSEGRFVVCVACNGAVEVATVAVNEKGIFYDVAPEGQVDAERFYSDLCLMFGIS